MIRPFILAAMMATPAVAGEYAENFRQFQIYCAQNPRECPRGGARVIVWTPKLADDLFEINRRVNATMRQVEEKQGEDVWQADVLAGDCEDNALTKRRRLIEKNYPAMALRPYVYRLRDGRYHLVLAVVTDQGTYALNNMTSRIERMK